MNRKSIIYLIVITSIFAGIYIFSFTNLKNVEKKFYEKMPKEVERITNESLRFIENEEIESLVQLFVREYAQKGSAVDEMRSISKQIAIYGNHKSKKLIGYWVNSFNGVESHTVTYELEYDNDWLVFRTVVSTEDNSYKLYRVDFDRLDSSISEMNKFTFKNKTITHYVVLLFHISITLFTLITSAICFGSNKPKRVLWAILILIGVGFFQFNWTNGQMSYQTIAIGIPTTGVSKGGTVAPIILWMRVPLIGIIYWIRRNKSEVEDRDILKKEEDN